MPSKHRTTKNREEIQEIIGTAISAGKLVQVHIPHGHIQVQLRYDNLDDNRIDVRMYEPGSGQIVRMNFRITDVYQIHIIKEITSRAGATGSTQYILYVRDNR